VAPTYSSDCPSPARSRGDGVADGAKPIIFALANPVRTSRRKKCARFATTRSSPLGRSDYPNQVTTSRLPFIFRGALDVTRDGINEEMKMPRRARSRCCAQSRNVPDSVAALYGLPQRARFGADYLIPFPFDPRVLLWVAPAVAWAAVASGVAREFIDVESYRERLEERLGRAREDHARPHQPARHATEAHRLLRR